jgi:hypothetical protein
MPVIIVPNFILEVTPARTDMVVQLSSMGSSKLVEEGFIQREMPTEETVPECVTGFSKFNLSICKTKPFIKRTRFTDKKDRNRKYYN